MKYEREAGKGEKRGKTFSSSGWPSGGKKRPSFLHNLDKNVSGLRGSKHKQLLNLFAPNFLVLGNKKKQQKTSHSRESAPKIMLWSGWTGFGGEYKEMRELSSSLQMIYFSMCLSVQWNVM